MRSSLAPLSPTPLVGGAACQFDMRSTANQPAKARPILATADEVEQKLRQKNLVQCAITKFPVCAPQVLRSYAAASSYNIYSISDYTGLKNIYMMERCKPGKIHGCLDPFGHVVGGTPGPHLARSSKSPPPK
ncbi:hypothetical protein P171DRAFT_438333 [Karstenula rhodostoma CBS 690.94]|uniref:Uncharacterized protein n=1 Tax=Karstenula rhodostoma CBS 690.94 TaxID=1392251 RepID=A0A9P4PZB2_9PLEO|nr:hypothetical protein P171DRAFT_438333 [Karstenula rhodostoma CBS 690.94]